MAQLLIRSAAAVAAGTTALMAALTVTQALPDVATAGPAMARSATDAGERAESRARRAFTAMPLAFEANRGQVDARARYVARGQGFTLFLTRRGAVFDLRGAAPEEDTSQRAAPGAAVALVPVGADRSPRLVGKFRQGGTSSYFHGDDPSRWQRGVPTFGRVRYQGVYRGIDLDFRGSRSGAEYDFVVAPGADPSRIGYRLRGADSLHLQDGDLVASTAAGDFVHHAPVAYQRVRGERRTVPAAFRVVDGVVSFALGRYDHRRPLVIDPETDLEYSTFLGGSGDDDASAIAVDGSDVYVTGQASSPDFPTTTGAYDTTRSTTSDVFVTRISPDGAGPSDLVYSTFLGGDSTSGFRVDESGLGIAAVAGDVYVTGFTTSPDFPTTDGAFDGALSGTSDGFLAVISPDGAGAADLVYSTFVGGGSEDSSEAIAVEGGDAYLTGETFSAGFPLTSGALDTTNGNGDAFVTRISPDGAGAADLVYSTFLGGGDDYDDGYGIAVADGDVYVSGETRATNFPTTAGAYDRTSNGELDAFVTRVSPDGAGKADLEYSTLLGGPKYDRGRGIAVEGGDIYLIGRTSSARFPTTAGAIQRAYGGDTDIFVSRISPDAQEAADLVYSTFLGGAGGDEGEGIAVEGGDVYLVASTGVDYKYGGGSDIYVARITPAGHGGGDLRHATTFGGYDDDWAEGIAVDAGTAYVTGSTDNDDFETTPGAFDTTFGGNSDGFVTAVDASTDDLVWPDALIRRAGGREVGDDVYYAGGQTVSARVRPRHEKVFWITAQNDDNLPDSFLVTGAGRGSEKFRIRYYQAGVDITDQVTGDGYQTRSLPQGHQIRVKLTVRPRAIARNGLRKLIPVTVTSISDPEAFDEVEAEIIVRRH